MINELFLIERGVSKENKFRNEENLDFSIRYYDSYFQILLRILPFYETRGYGIKRA